MNTANKSAVFLVFAFAISWAIAIGARYAGLVEQLGGVAILAVMMAGPAAAALICAFAFEKGRRAEALGLRFKPNVYWPWAWAIPILLAVGSVVVTLLASDRTYVDLGQTIIGALEAQGAPEATLEQVRAIPQLGLIQIAAAITLGALINWPILTFTEELGWRGYLHHLWRPFGFWRTSLGTGFVWGLWHMPAIFFYGLNYPDNPLIGMALFTAFCMLVAPLLTFIRDRGGSVWVAGLFHGTFNAVGGITLGVISNPTFPWNGIVGIGGFVVLALGVAVVLALGAGRKAARLEGQNQAA